MLDDDCVVFVEVRYRGPDAISSAALTVDRCKQRKLMRAAEMFLVTRTDIDALPTRFDVIGVDACRHGYADIEWVRDAFGP